MPLEGITVVDLTRYLPGPYCTRMLADLGAAVVKVESPEGDPVRTVAWYSLLNDGKRVVTLDLRDEQGRRELDRLLSTADVCVEGFRPSTARAIGVDAETLRARHPQLVHCSISGYGQHGPGAERAGHDINYQAEVGLLAGRPAVPGLLVGDITSSYRAAIGILAALVGRGRTRAGAFVDVAISSAAAAWVPFRPPPVLRGDYACYNVYETADAQWLALGALERKFWERFCVRLGKPEWVALQFAPDPSRSLLLSELRSLIRATDAATWLRTFADVDCCLSPIAKL
jgi:crotonobetainyl-CoA:carnitine CoA-transferase CaiB-like acyl-CoA transferase